MNLKEVLSDSLSFPLSNPVRMIILGVMIALGFLILPIILSLGYLIRIIEYSSQGKREMPEFNNWVDMFVDGIKYFLVSFCYLLPGSIFITAAMFWIIFDFMFKHADMASNSTYVTAQVMNSFSPDMILTLGSGPLTLIIIGAILYLLGYLLQIMAIPQMVYKNNLGAAFDIRTLLHNIRVVSWKNYLVGSFILIFIVFAVTLINIYLQDFLNIYGALGYILSLILGKILISSFSNSFQGRFMGLIYPGEVENEKSESEQNPRFQPEPPAE